MDLNSFQTSGNSPRPAGCQVGILGFGTVGSAIARRLTGPDSLSTLHLTHIYNPRAREKRARRERGSTIRQIAHGEYAAEQVAGHVAERRVQIAWIAPRAVPKSSRFVTDQRVESIREAV